MSIYPCVGCVNCESQSASTADYVICPHLYKVLFTRGCLFLTILNMSVALHLRFFRTLLHDVVMAKQCQCQKQQERALKNTIIYNEIAEL